MRGTLCVAVMALTIAVAPQWVYASEMPAKSGHEAEKASDSEQPQTVMWEKLAELDVKSSGKLPPNLIAINGKRVRIPGFIVPLDDEFRDLKEFLLVPYPQACIHVPPPPPNQMILVKTSPDVKMKYMPFPYWIVGVLKIETKESAYGNVSYSLEATKLERYEQ